MDFSEEKLELLRKKNDRKGEAESILGETRSDHGVKMELRNEPDGIPINTMDVAKDLNVQAVFSKIYGHYDSQFPNPVGSNDSALDEMMHQLDGYNVNNVNNISRPDVHGQQQSQHQGFVLLEDEFPDMSGSKIMSPMKDWESSLKEGVPSIENGQYHDMFKVEQVQSQRSHHSRPESQLQHPNPNVPMYPPVSNVVNHPFQQQQVPSPMHSNIGIQQQHIPQHIPQQQAQQNHISQQQFPAPPPPKVSRDSYSSGNNSSFPSSGSSSSTMTNTTTPNATLGAPKLPNGKLHSMTFKKLTRIDRLRNVFLERYLKHFQSDIRHLNNLEFRNVAPVWTKKIAENFWTTVYNQSVVIDLYFSFFMDRSLNALLHKCKLLLNDKSFLENENVFFLNQPQDLLYKQYFFTPNDLDVLAHKSYSYYGEFIKDLRESLSLIHSEYPAKISLFAAWSTFLHSHSSVDTYCLLFSGTTTLFTKVFNTATSLNHIPPTINTGFYIFINHSNTCLIPDYDFQVIVDLHKDLVLFKKVSQDLSKKWIDSENEKIIVNVKIARHCFDLEIFLRKLIEVYYPQIIAVNNAYKRKYRPNDTTNNIYFVRVKSFYEMINHWFSIYPAEAIPMGSKYNAMWKTFYLFFTAIGKALSQIITPIRSLMLVDPNSTFCPRVDFDPSIYKIEVGQFEKADFEFYNELSTKLIRISSFFNNRVLFYSYYLSTVTVLDQEYIKHVVDDNSELQSNNSYGSSSGTSRTTPSTPSPLDGDEEYTDILHILPDKLNIHETFISNFDNTMTIVPENYPVMEHFREEFNRLLSIYYQQQLQSQRMDESHFHIQNKLNYDTGLYNRDFNPDKWIELIITRQKQAWEDERTTLEQSQHRMHIFDLGRQEVNKSIH
ncbi:hypothetical protein CLIB1423_09S02982 [[Candida] railenensis]|uniref:Uncharacterized protein n=1 Tax=[Candida] railenensis TaxID=45579 RepID=A0A9P0VYK9_9ASCO|nr:hypothetical protein CLIB1423_09S02982 [[Candida] railenensis]